jgi:hypothetical protein
MKIETVGSREPISVREFIEIADRVYDPSVESSVWDLRGPLAALARNTEAILSGVKVALASRMSAKMIVEQPTYFVIYRGENYSLRVTIWLPENRQVNIRKVENGMFAYDYPHNHNFTLLTSTVLGPGYHTRLYRLDELVAGAVIGQRFEAEDLGHFQLVPGSVLLYEAGLDVHSQVPVDEVSVALNFIPTSAEQRGLPQYGFRAVDRSSLEVVGYPLSQAAREVGGARVLAKLEKSGLIDSGILDGIAERHTNRSVQHYVRGLARGTGANGRTLDSDIEAEIRAGITSANYETTAAKVAKQRGRSLI